MLALTKKYQEWAEPGKNGVLKALCIQVSDLVLWWGHCGRPSFLTLRAGGFVGVIDERHLLPCLPTGDVAVSLLQWSNCSSQRTVHLTMWSADQRWELPDGGYKLTVVSYSQQEWVNKWTLYTKTTFRNGQCCIEVNSIGVQFYI